MSCKAPEKIFLNGTVIPMTDPGQSFEAVAVKEAKILKVGKSDDIKSMAGPDTVVHDLGGRTLLPGFIDPHGHILAAAATYSFMIDLASPPVGTVRNVSDLKAKLKAQVALTPPGGWILGYGYDDTLLEEKRHPTAEDLDSVSSEHSIFIKHVSGHLSVANSHALKIGGIDSQAASPRGGHIRRKSGSNEPNGVLEEPAAGGLVEHHVPQRTQEEWLDAIQQVTEKYLRKGVTTANDGFTRPEAYQHLLAAHEQGILKIRVQVWPASTMPLDGYPTTASGTPITEDNLISMGALKFFQDGSIQGYTAYISNPYFKSIYDQSQGELYRGWPIFNREDFIDKIVHFHRQGWQIAIHGNGDAAIQDIIDAVEEAQKKYPRADVRHVIIHCQTVREDQLDRMKRLGMIPAFFPPHIYYWGDRHYELFLGPFRAERINPCRSAMTRGMAYTSHNDTYVTPIDPLLSVWSAVNRLTFGGRVLGEDQRIPVYEALKTVTTYAAFQYHEEARKGSIEVGKLADFVVLDENPLSIDAVRIKDIAVKATIVGGEIVWGGLGR